MKKRVAAAAVALVSLAPLTSGCGLVGGPDLVIYNAQHEELMTEIVPIFEEQTGLDVELRNNTDRPLATGSSWLQTYRPYGVSGTADNLTRITVDGSSNNKDWLKVHVNAPGSSSLLSWSREPYTS